MPLADAPSSLLQARRAEFDRSDFARLIRDHGHDVRWSKATLCPNRDPNQEDHHRLNCNVCDDNGYVYFDPTDTRMFMASFSDRQTFQAALMYEAGQVYVTAQPDEAVSFWDKIEVLDSTARFSEIVKLTTATTYKLRYAAVSVARVVNNLGAVIAATTYRLDTAGQLVFTTLPAGAFIAVSYTYRPAYIVLDMIHHVRDARQTEQCADVMRPFPVQAMAKLDWLVTQSS